MKSHHKRFPSGVHKYLLLVMMISWVSAWGQSTIHQYYGRTFTDSIAASSHIQSLSKSSGNQAVTFEQIFFINSTTGWVVGSGGIIYKTTTGGATWVEENSPTTNTMINVFFANQNYGWACGFNGTIVNTSNGGATWVLQQSGVSSNLLSLYFIDASHGWACGDSGVVLSTTNGGSVWTSHNCGPIYNLRGISFANMNQGWAVGNPGIIFHTTNGGTSWTPQTSNTTLPIYSVEAIDSLHGWATGGNYTSDVGVILRTTNGGTTWTNITNLLPSLPPFFDLDFLNASTGWIVGRYGLILRTTDGGSYWIDQGIDYSWLHSVSFVNSNNGWTSVPNGTLLCTTNSGINWSYQSLTNIVTPVVTEMAINDVPNDNGRQVFAKWWISGSPISSSITSFSIYRYDESNWTYLDNIPVLSDSIYQVVAPTIYDSTIVHGMHWSVFRVIAHTANPEIYTIIGPDSGYSVDNLPPLAPTSGSAIKMVNGNTIVRWKPAINRNGDFKEYILYRSLQQDFDPSVHNRIAMVQDTVFIDMTSQGNRYYYKVTSEDYSGNESEPLLISTLLGIELDNSGIPGSYNLSQNYPNPFNPSTNIKFDIPQDSYVTLKVYDLGGREITNLLSKTMPAGYYTIPFHSAHLSNGIYLYRLQAGKYVFTKKMILLK